MVFRGLLPSIFPQAEIARGSPAANWTQDAYKKSNAYEGYNSVPAIASTGLQDKEFFQSLVKGIHDKI